MNDIITNGIGGQDVAYLLLRVATGLFFLISGYHKLFNADRRKAIRSTLEADGIPFVPFTSVFVPAVEFTAGIALALGLWTPVSAGLLAIILTVALLTDGYKRVAEFRPIDFADKVDDYLYLSETVYLLILIVFITTGPGIYVL